MLEKWEHLNEIGELGLMWETVSDVLEGTFSAVELRYTTIP